MSDITSLQNKFLIVISGPTGIGKTEIALRLAEKYNAEIFSADSRQIYKEMSVGTAKPDTEQLQHVVHHFINQISIFEKYSVGHYENELRAALNKYYQSHNTAILTGGTGLYIRALLDGMDDFPEIPEIISTALHQQYIDKGVDYIREMLQKKDPTYYSTVDKSNHRRILRALGIIETTGKSYSSFLRKKENLPLPFFPIQILLELPREQLYDQINQRVDQMMEKGLLQEAIYLHKYKGLPSLETVGYQELFSYLEGNIDLTTAIALIKQNTRRYAKRQMTWFRKFGTWKIHNPQNYDMILEEIECQMIDKNKIGT